VPVRGPDVTFSPLRREKGQVSTTQANPAKNMNRFICALIMGVFLVAPVSAQNFGGAAAMAGDDVVVGMSGQNSTNSTVYVYRKAADGSWEQAELLVASDNNGQDDRFGRALAADASTLVVGATLMNNSTGGAYVFTKNASGDWVETQKLLGEDSSEEESFGRSLALDGDWLVVGAAGADGGRGAAYVFHRGADGSWSQHSKLQEEESEEGAFYGLAVAMDSGNLLVAAPLAGDEADGNVYAYYYHEDQDAFVAHGRRLEFRDGTRA